MTQNATRYAHHIPSELIESGLPASRIAVFCYIASRANKQRQAWPSIQTIAKALDFSARTVKRCLKELTKAGFLFIDKIASKFGPWLRNKYQLPDWEKPKSATSDTAVTYTSDSRVTLTKEPKNKLTSSNELHLETKQPKTVTKDDEESENRVSGKVDRLDPAWIAFRDKARERAAFHWVHPVGRENALYQLYKQGVTIETLRSLLDRVSDNAKASAPRTWAYFTDMALASKTSQTADAVKQGRGDSLDARTTPYTPHNCITTAKPTKPTICTNTPDSGLSPDTGAIMDKDAITEGFAALRKRLRGF